MEKVNAYLQITMKIKENDRPSAAKVYFDYCEPFLQTIEGALTKNLLVRDEDVQVLHGFDSKEQLRANYSHRKKSGMNEQTFAMPEYHQVIPLPNKKWS